MELYRRKLFLLGFLLLVYVTFSFWVPYSKLWFIRDIMQTQSRLFFATRSTAELRNYLIQKAEALDIALEPKDVTVKNINGEILYIELQYDVPLDILFYHTTLHFEPKTFGLIREFDMGGKYLEEIKDPYQCLAELSDSTKRFLQTRTFRKYFMDFFSK